MAFRTNTLAALLALLGACQPPPAASLAAEAPKISVVGAGTVATFPNAAQLTLLVRFVRPALRDAIGETQQTSRTIQQILKKYVADTTDVKISLIATDKSTRWDQVHHKDVLVGYEASQRTIFTLSELKRMQDFTEEVLRTRIDEIEEVSYFHTEGARFMKQAQEIAVQDALASTARLAKASHLRLGRVVYLETSDSPNDAADESVESYRVQAFSKAMAVRGVASSGQLITYRARVSLQMAIE